MHEEEAPIALTHALDSSWGGANASGAYIGPHEEAPMLVAPMYVWLVYAPIHLAHTPPAIFLIINI
jgi:hypothetical protein